jgi:hypothetical protein
MTNSPITPSEGLVASLRNSAPHGIRDAGVTREIWLINHAYQSGADQELEACCKLLELSDSNAREFLTAARRPKPPSLKERALQAWAAVEAGTDDQTAMAVIRRALEALDD